MKYRHIVGISLLIIAVISYIYLAYILPANEIMDDSIGWFHKHVIRLIIKGENYSDHYLWFPESFDLLRTPIFIDKMVVSLGLASNPGLLTIIFGAILAIIAYIIGYSIFKEPIAAGIGSLIGVLTPTTLYWFRINMFGSYIAGVIGILTLITIGYALKKNSKLATILSIILFIATWLLWSSAWFIQIVYSLYIIALIYSGRITKNSLYIGLALLVFSLPINLMGISYYITMYHVFSVVLLTVSLILAYVEYRIVTRFREPIKRNIWRFLGVFIPFIISISLTLIINQIIELPGIPESYLKAYKPFADYMAVAILAPFSIVLFLRAGYFEEIEKSFIEFFAVAGFMTGMIAAFIDPPLSVYSSILAAPIIAYGLERLATVTIKGVKSRWKYLYFIGTLWIIVSAIMANAYASYTVSTAKPTIYYGPVTRDLVKTPPKSSPLLEVLKHVENESLVIVDWTRSYWIIGYKDVFIIADPNAPLYNKRLISQIFVSDEYVSLGIINDLVKEYGIRNVYILISEVISVENTTGEFRSAHIGRPIITTTREGLQQANFLPVGDTAKFIEYLNLANYSLTKYIDKNKATYGFQIPLAWKEEAKGTVLIKLIITAIDKLGYPPVNDVYSKTAVYLLEEQKPTFIEFVNASTTYLYTIRTDFMSYNVYYMAALFRVDLEAFAESVD